MVVVEAPPVGTAVELDVFDLTLGSKRILGSCHGNSEPAEMIPYLAGLVGDGQLPLDRLVTTYPFEEIERAAADMSAGRVIKPVLVFSQADSRD